MHCWHLYYNELVKKGRNRNLNLRLIWAAWHLFSKKIELQSACFDKKRINQQCCNVIGLNFAKFCNSFFMKSCAEQHEKDNFFREFLVVRIFFTPTLPTLSHSKESCVYWLSERTSISVHSIHKSNCFRRKKNIFFFLPMPFTEMQNLEMVFCYQNYCDILWEKIVSSDWGKHLKFRGWRTRICKFWDH